MGDLNINVEHPHDEREATLADLLDKINLVDTSRKFNLRQCSFQKARKRWTWRRKRRGRWIYSQPDYIMAREDRVARFRMLASNLRRSMIPITARLSLTCGKGEMGPSRPIDETANGSPSHDSSI